MIYLVADSRGRRTTKRCVVFAAASTYYLTRDKGRDDYFLASIGEIRRVTWPNFIDTRRMTIVVCVVVGVFAAILFVFDFLWAEVLKLLLSAGK